MKKLGRGGWQCNRGAKSWANNKFITKEIFQKSRGCLLASILEFWKTSIDELIAFRLIFWIRKLVSIKKCKWKFKVD